MGDENLSTNREASPATRRAYFGPDHGWREAAVIGRADLAAGREGPAIVEEYDATCVVPPGVSAALNAAGCIVLDTRRAAEADRRH